MQQLITLLWCGIGIGFRSAGSGPGAQIAEGIFDRNGQIGELGAGVGDPLLAR